MNKPKSEKKKKLGRPYIGVSRRGITLKESDILFLKEFGHGSLTLGIRLAAEKLRTLKGTL
jgi:hypothetical protein